jgi:hypothetical protein
MVRSNGELSAQMKILRSQSEKPRETSLFPEDMHTVEPHRYLASPSAAIIKDKERQIDALQLELADLEVRLAEQANSAVSRNRQIEEALLQAKLENIRLAENVESYQMLLQDRTLKGEYPIMSLEGVREDDETEISRENSPTISDDTSKVTSLAAELEEAEAELPKIKRTDILGA